MQYKYSRTDRGFDLIEWGDANSQECSLQQSSAVDLDREGSLENPGSSYVWLGVGDNRIHLDQANAEMLIGQLSNWLECGHLIE